jgi:hypothetical protein
MSDDFCSAHPKSTTFQREMARKVLSIEGSRNLWFLDESMPRYAIRIIYPGKKDIQLCTHKHIRPYSSHQDPSPHPHPSQPHLHFPPLQQHPQHHHHGQ